ncbi:unnamed protein product, partial [Ranitomeya imitator]
MLNKVCEFYCKHSPTEFQPGNSVVRLGSQLSFAENEPNMILIVRSRYLQVDNSCNGLRGCIREHMEFRPSASSKPYVATAGEGLFPNTCTRMRYSTISLLGSLSLYHRNLRKFLWSSWTMKQWNICSMLAVMAMGSFLNLINTPTKLFVRLGPRALERVKSGQGLFTIVREPYPGSSEGIFARASASAFFSVYERLSLDRSAFKRASRILSLRAEVLEQDDLYDRAECLDEADLGKTLEMDGRRQSDQHKEMVTRPKEPRSRGGSARSSVQSGNAAKMKRDSEKPEKYPSSEVDNRGDGHSGGRKTLQKSPTEERRKKYPTEESNHPTIKSTRKQRDTPAKKEKDRETSPEGSNMIDQLTDHVKNSPKEYNGFSETTHDRAKDKSSKPLDRPQKSRYPKCKSLDEICDNGQVKVVSGKKVCDKRSKEETNDVSILDKGNTEPKENDLKTASSRTPRRMKDLVNGKLRMKMEDISKAAEKVNKVVSIILKSNEFQGDPLFKDIKKLSTGSYYERVKYYTAFYGRTKSQHAAFVTVLRKKYANESLWKREKYGFHTDKQCDLREIRSAVREKSRFHTTNISKPNEFDIMLEISVPSYNTILLTNLDKKGSFYTLAFKGRSPPAMEEYIEEGNISANEIMKKFRGLIKQIIGKADGFKSWDVTDLRKSEGLQHMHTLKVVNKEASLLINHLKKTHYSCEARPEGEFPLLQTLGTIEDTFRYLCPIDLHWYRNSESARSDILLVSADTIRYRYFQISEKMEDVTLQRKDPGSPAVTISIRNEPQDISVDLVIALKIINRWPEETKGGMKIDDWLGMKVKLDYKRSHFYMVPKRAMIGNRTLNADTWRISFSNIEKEILSNHGNGKTCCESGGSKKEIKQCLKLLKFLLELFKENGKQRKMDQFCSYHAKTALLHLCAKHPKDDDWKLEDLESCFDRYVRFFQDRLKNYTLDNFFLPSHNLFSSESVDKSNYAALKPVADRPILI